MTEVPCGASHDFLLKLAPPSCLGWVNSHVGNVSNVGIYVNPRGAFVTSLTVYLKHKYSIASLVLYIAAYFWGVMRAQKHPRGLTSVPTLKTLANIL